MAAGWSQVEVAERVLAGEPLPTFAQMVAQLEAAQGDERAWGRAVRSLRQVQRGIEAAISWQAARSWVTDERSAKALLATSEPDLLRDLGAALRTQVSVAIEDAVATMARSTAGSDALLLVALGQEIDGRFAGADELAGTVGRVVEEGVERAAFTVEGTLALAADVNLGRVLLPLVAVRDAPSLDDRDRFHVATRSGGLLSEQTKLTTGLAAAVNDDLRLPLDMEDRAIDAMSAVEARRGAALGTDGEIRAAQVDDRPWHPDRTRVVADPAPHLEYVAEDGDGTTRVGAIDVRATTAAQGWVEDFEELPTVAAAYRYLVQQGQQHNLLHSGCPADVALRAEPGAPRISALRMLYQRCAQLAVATGALSPTGEQDPKVAIVVGQAAFTEVVIADRTAQAQLAKSDVRRERLLEQCPRHAGRRAVRRASVPGSVAGAASSVLPSPVAPPGPQPTDARAPATRATARSQGRGPAGLGST